VGQETAWIICCPSGTRYLLPAYGHGSSRQQAERSPEERGPSSKKDAFSKAARDFNACLSLSHKPLLSYYHALDESLVQGNSKTSRRFLELATKIDPDSFIVRDKFIDSLRLRWGGTVAPMCAFLDDCRKENLSAAHLKALEAIVLDEQGWVDENVTAAYIAAERDYRRAVALGRDDCAPCAHLGNVLVHQKEYPEAIRVFSSILRSDPTNVGVVASRAFANLQLGKTREAIVDWTAAAEAGDAYSQSELGRMYMIGVPGVLKPDFNTGPELFRRSAAQGYEAGRQNLERALALVPAAHQ
jgi:tetratricopeptide (TPR) repeat protein